MKTMLIMLCMTLSMCATAADKKPSPKRTSLSESELRAIATEEPSVKNAAVLYSVAMATSNNVERKQTYLTASAACLFACEKTDIYKKRIKKELTKAAEVENKLKEKCKKCFGNGKIGHQCYVCNGKGLCSSCKGSGRTVTMGFNRPNGTKPCHKCGGGGRCQKCGGTGSDMEKCSICLGTGIVLRKAIAERVFRDSCNAIADNMAAEVRAKAEAEKRERERIAAEARVKAEEEKREGERIAAEARAKAEAEERKRKYISEADGDADILCKRGFKYYLGDGVLQDYYRAIEYLDCASEIGCPRADCILAYMYLRGEGCKKDDVTKTKSFVHAKKGLACKDKVYEVAACVLGILYCTGFKDTHGSYKMDAYQAYRYFSACESESDALFFKGLMEYHGIGTVKNPEKAAETFYAVTKVSDSNFNKGRAQMCLGYIYFRGEGVAKNIDLAWKMLREGVELAYPKLVKAAKEPLTVEDFKRFKKDFGNSRSIHSPFSWKMYNLYKGQGKFNLGGGGADILERALTILFAAEFWGGFGIEYDLLPDEY